MDTLTIESNRSAFSSALLGVIGGGVNIFLLRLELDDVATLVGVMPRGSQRKKRHLLATHERNKRLKFSFALVDRFCIVGFLQWQRHCSGV